MTEVIRAPSAKGTAWGPLGNPSKETIQSWCNMPAGEFARMVKEKVGRCSRKKLDWKDRDIYLTRTVVIKHQNYAKVTVHAGDDTDALKLARDHFEQHPEKIEWSEPYTIGETLISSATYKPYNYDRRIYACTSNSDPTSNTTPVTE